MAVIDALLAGGAALYVWAVLAMLHPPVVTPILRWLRRSWIKPLIACGWCSGFWLGILFTVALQWDRLDWIVTPITALAAAALCGFVGSLTPGFDEEEDE